MLTALAIVASMALSAPHVYVAPISGVQQSGSSMPFEPAINFTGSSVSCVDDPANSRITCTVSGGAGSANVFETSVVLANTPGFYPVTVTGLGWVTTATKLACTPYGTTADGLTAEAIAVGNLGVTWSTPVAGVGVTVNVYSPRGLTGTVRIQCSGA
jgi:hypothetical protein